MIPAPAPAATRAHNVATSRGPGDVHRPDEITVVVVGRRAVDDRDDGRPGVRMPAGVPPGAIVIPVT